MVTAYDQRNQTSSTCPGGQQWPESLKKYASRCFSACTTTEDKDMVEIILKGKIAATAASNTLWSKDWSKEELPGVLCRKSSGGGGAGGGKSKVELEREKLPLNAFAEHKVSCQFRSINCPSYLCNKRVVFTDLVNHLLNHCEHSNQNFARENASSAKSAAEVFMEEYGREA